MEGQHGERRKHETVAELCERVGISRRLFEKMKTGGRGPVITKFGTRVLIAPEDAAAWLESLKVKPAGERAA